MAKRGCRGKEEGRNKGRREVGEWERKEGEREGREGTCWSWSNSQRAVRTRLQGRG